MSKITIQYVNKNNGGNERVIRDGDSYYVNSDFGSGFARANTTVSRSQIESCMAHTNAPSDVVSAITGAQS